MNGRENIGWLTQRIDAFIRKYYQNKLLKGLIIIGGSILLYVLLLLLGEYFLYLPPFIKLTALIVPGIIGLYALIRYIIIPLFQTLRLGKVISNEEAAKIIGQHFPEVGDMLLNILQLQHQSISTESKALAEASIAQKSKELAPFHFARAIQLRKNLRWFPLLLIPLVIGVAIYFWNPQIIKQSSSRLLKPATQFHKPAPFEFILENDVLKVEQYGDLEVFLKLQGEAIPAQANLIIDGQRIPMKALGNNRFSFLLRKITEEKSIQFEAAGYYSQSYALSLLYKPSLAAAKLELEYPAYTQRQKESIQGFTDLTVPEGTRIIYSVTTKNVSDAALVIDDQLTYFVKNNYNYFTLQVQAKEDFSYSVHLTGKDNLIDQGNNYQVQVVKDQFPQVRIEQKTERISGEQILLIGDASDDYGLTKAQVVFNILNAEGKQIGSQSMALELSGKTTSSLQYYFDIATFNLLPGQQLNYYVEVWDNDGVNGPKSARSQVFVFKTHTNEEASKLLEENKEELNKNLASGKEKMKELEEQLRKMQESQVNKNNLTEWEKQQQSQLLQEQQETFRQQMEEIQKRLEKQKELIEQKQYNESIQEKQEALEKQLDNLLNKELAEQMQKLQELLQQRNREMNMQDIQQMQQQNSLFQMDLERIEAMIKQLESQIMIEEMARKLDELADRQDDLNNRTTDETSNNDALAKEQQQLKNELDQLLNESMKELEQKAEDHNFSNEKKAGEDASKFMQESKEQLNQKNNPKSKSAQQNASEQMRQMSKSLNEKSQGMDMEQLDIDIKATRQLLTNLLRLSFDQEALMQDLRITPLRSSEYPKLIRKQNQLREAGKLIKDSLFALSKRVPQLGPGINKETVELEKRLGDAVRYLEERQTQVVGVSQQYAMTSANNLALMLNDVLSNLLTMQAQASGQGDGQGSGQGMGQGKGKSRGQQQGDGGAGDKMKDIITGQQQMGKGLRELREMQGQSGGNGQGQQNGEGGQSGSNGNGNSSGDNESEKMAEMLSRLAYEQAKLRQQIQELQSIMNSKRIKGNARMMREILEEMDRLETDLINRKISDDLLQRQNEILTRLLKAEEAIREQEMDNQRQADVGRDVPRSIPPELQKYIDQQQHIKEKYHTVPPELKPFYKKISENYLDKISS